MLVIWIAAWAVVATVGATVALVVYLRKRKLARSLAAAADLLSGELLLMRGKRDEILACIEGIVKEATDARSLYVTCGAQHAAAQSMMLREIESLAKQYSVLVAEYAKKTGERPGRPAPRLNQQIQTVADDFRDAHVQSTDTPEQLQSLLDQAGSLAQGTQERP